MKLKQSMYDKKTWLPFMVVENSFSERWERSLLFYCQLKHVYKKPIIYNYTLRKIGELMQCSPTSVKYHLDLLKEKGLIFISGKNLNLTGVTNLLNKCSTKKFLVPVKYFKDKKEHLTSLRYVLIKRNFRLQERAINSSINIINYHQGKLKNLTSRQVKSLLKKEKDKEMKTKTTVEKSFRNFLILSNQKFGSLCNRGILTGLKIQKDLNSLGFITSHHRVRFYLGKNFKSKKDFYYYKEFNPNGYLNNSYLLSNKGNLYKKLPNGVEVKEEWG